eukprot:7391062-Alexandrium_andersonii.AAC.1
MGRSVGADAKHEDMRRVRRQPVHACRATRILADTAGWGFQGCRCRRRHAQPTRSPVPSVGPGPHHEQRVSTLGWVRGSSSGRTPNRHGGVSL